MASANGSVHKMVAPVAACIVLVVLSMGPLVMADVEDDCVPICLPACDDLSSKVCSSLSATLPILKNLDFFYPTCEVRVTTLCKALCFNICSLNTLTPSAPMPAPGSTAAPPPCKP
jgi:hypothetical protein